jgi:hypothetical protein
MLHIDAAGFRKIARYCTATTCYLNLLSLSLHWDTYSNGKKKFCMASTIFQLFFYIMVENIQAWIRKTFGLGSANLYMPALYTTPAYMVI